ncbi:hypothetical protein GCM10010399_30040 [Dactylosporangium fulvum]|uniref:Uncharacterized protein n=1 Tax=Dactylosporangium fulvum TaxID=53359 RepID=A0ABY5W1R7_9ACTN|nr:hypothetical protein [Dactylosporangium fulvum]UWP83860.1 hypothetical protein Dfulv_06270 [Dactylosporangium fulvum]
MAPGRRRGSIRDRSGRGEREAGDGAVAGVAIRCVVYAAVIVTALRMRAGKRWARLALALMLGIIGTLSLVMEPIGWLLDGNSVGAQLADADTAWWLIAVARTVHVAAVWGAVPLMFVPSAGRHFQRTPRPVAT